MLQTSLPITYSPVLLCCGLKRILSQVSKTGLKVGSIASAFVGKASLSKGVWAQADMNSEMLLEYDALSAILLDLKRKHTIALPGYKMICFYFI